MLSWMGRFRSFYDWVIFHCIHTTSFSPVPTLRWLPYLVVQSLSHVRLFATPWTPAHQDFLSFTISQGLLKLMSVESMTPSNHLILCRPLLLLPSVFPSIRVFFSELALRIRWPKYWNFSFSISPSNEYSELISFRIDWLDLLAFQGTLKSLLQQHNSSNLWQLAFFQSSLWSNSHIYSRLQEKPQLWLYRPLSSKWKQTIPCNLV